ncbi:MAG: hypothetical protein ABUT20_65170, partial [Bacteroidota bacterium]
MKKQIYLLLAALLTLSISFTSCKKNSDSSTTDTATELKDQSDDQAFFSNESDAVANDASQTAENYNTMSGGGRVATNFFAPLCGANLSFDTTGGVRTITITYTGDTCMGRSRTGVVTMSIPAGVHWRDAGAVMTITITNLKITRVVDGRSITINGSKTITNVSGGLLHNLALLPNPIVHKIESAGMTITFDNNTQRAWQIAKIRTFTYDAGVVIRTAGFHTDGAYTNIAEWGTNRHGHPFATSISTSSPVTIRQTCAWRITSGEVVHRKLAATATVTFGLDASGNPTTCPGLTG